MEWRTGEPEKSGRYVVMYDTGSITTISFSKKHHVFNTEDWAEEEHVKNVGISIEEVAAWVPYEEFIEEQGLKCMLES